MQVKCFEIHFVALWTTGLWWYCVLCTRNKKEKKNRMLSAHYNNNILICSICEAGRRFIVFVLNAIQQTLHEKKYDSFVFDNVFRYENKHDAFFDYFFSGSFLG